MVNQKSEAQPETIRPDFFDRNPKKNETPIKKFQDVRPSVAYLFFVASNSCFKKSLLHQQLLYNCWYKVKTTTKESVESLLRVCMYAAAAVAPARCDKLGLSI